MRNYRADVFLHPDGNGGTRIHWHAEFDSKPRGTGWLLRLILGPYLRFLAGKTGRVAELRS